MSLNYGKLTAIALDPIEKKPFADYRPGSHILSVGSFGCNMRCPFCQNSSISMADDAAPVRSMPPEKLVRLAVSLVPQHNIGIAFTYNEPLISLEYVLDCAKLIRAEGLDTVLVTNGMVSPTPLQRLLPAVQAMNVDLKAFTPKAYQSLGGDLNTVKHTIEAAAGACHVEVTTLIIPGFNDGDTEMAAEAEWLSALPGAVTLHITRFFPHYQMARQAATPLPTIERLCTVACRYLPRVVKGNC